MTAEELERALAERDNDYWYEEGEPEMQYPRATAVDLTEVVLSQETTGRWRAEIMGSGLLPVYGESKIEALGILVFFNRAPFRLRLIVVEE